MEMLEFNYERRPSFVSASTLTVERQTYWYKPRPLPELTEEEQTHIPLTFRCYVCGEKQKKKDFGGWVVKQSVCRRCYPWVDDPTVGHKIRWDENHGYTQYIRPL